MLYEGYGQTETVSMIYVYGPAIVYILQKNMLDFTEVSIPSQQISGHEYVCYMLGVLILHLSMVY